MIVLTQWSALQPAPLGYVPQVALVYPLLNVGTLQDTTVNTARFPVQVSGDALALAALAADYRFPVLAQGVPVLFADYQNGLRACHDNRLAQTTIPVTISSTAYQVPATKVYQDYLAGVAAEVLAGAASVNVAFAGAIHTLTAATFKTAYLAYRSGLRNVNGVDHISVRGQIESATTAADLDAVTF